MNKYIGIGLVALSLAGHAAAIPPIDIITDPLPDPLVAGPPAEPSPAPGVVNPFVDSVRVKFTNEKKADIAYDFSDTDDSLVPSKGTAKVYEGEEIPIYRTGFLRTIAVNSDGTVGFANYHYKRDANPVVAWETVPPPGPYKVGASILLRVTVTDPDISTPYSVKYSRFAGGGGAGGGWEDIGTGEVKEGYPYTWIVNAPVGPVTLRAIAYDAPGAADTVTAIIEISANQHPTIAWFQPANNSRFNAPATFDLVTTPADGDGVVTKVEFFQDGVLIGTDSEGPEYKLARTSLPEKVYKYTAVAYDNGTPSLSTTSAEITVTVVNLPPTVAITFPEKNKQYYANFSAPITVNAFDPENKMMRVDYYINSATTPDLSNNKPPYGVSKVFSAGAYTLTAWAYDSSGLFTKSEPLSFTVVQNTRPTARAVKDTAIILPTNYAPVNGSTSSDAESTLRYKWSGPVGVTFTPSDTVAVATANFPSGDPGTYRLKLAVSDRAPVPLSDSAFIIILVQSKPVITSALSASGTSSALFSYTVTATGYPAPTLAAAGRPTWLAFNPANGLLSGTPTGGPVNFVVTLTANSPAGTDTKSLSISISDSLFKPKITSPLTATAKIGAVMAPPYTITATGNPSIFTYTATGLPPGLSHAAGVISGTPTTTPGPYPVNITVTNEKGSDAKVLNFTVLQDPKFTLDLPDSVPTVVEKAKVTFTVSGVGYPAITYQWQFSATSATGNYVNVGTNAATYTIDSASLGSAGWYRMVLKNGVGPDLIGKACRLKVILAPAPVKIATGGQPGPVSTVVGARVVFRAKATGEPAPLLYQWFKDGAPITPAAKANDTLYVIDSAKETSAGIYRARVTNGRDTSVAANIAWSDNALLTVQLPKLTKPEAKPAGYNFFPQANVVLSHPVAGAVIHYTLSGADPTPDSLKYVPGEIIRVTKSRTIKAIAVAPKYRNSDPMSETYTLTEPGKVNKPLIAPTSQTFTANIQCAITATPSDAQIFYTRNGGHPSTGGTLYTGPFDISATTIITAYAKKNDMTDSDTAQMVYTLQKGRNKVLTPEISPNGGSFTNTMKVTVFCPTAQAGMRYTLDGKSPDSTSTPYTAATGIVLTKSATVKVKAFLKDWDTSDVASADFKLGPGLITATPSPDIFPTSVTVKLQANPANAIIRYTQDGTPASKDSPVFPSDGLTLTNTTTISALAVLDGVAGTVQSFSYTLQGGLLATPTPVTSSGSFTFKDTVHVTLYSTRDAQIYYSKDGSPPALIPGNLYSGKILLDETTTLHAIAVRDGFENSKMLVATYTLVPEKPTISKRSGTFPLPIKVTLDCSSKKAKLFWTMDSIVPTAATGNPYTRGDSIPIKFSGTLRAVAIAGNMASPVAEETYTHFQVQDTILKPGQTLYMEGNYTLRNAEDQKAQVQVRIAGADLLRLKGFEDVQFSLNLSLANVPGNLGMEFPQLTFTTSASEKRSLYKLEPSGLVYYVTTADTVTLSQGGTYFLGTDVSKPVITYMREFYDTRDSTRVDFLVEDNVANLSYDVKRNDDSTRNLSSQNLFSGQEVGWFNKHLPRTLKPLYVQLIVSDHQRASFYPEDQRTMLSLSQKLNPLVGPEAWKIGANPKSLYDMIGIPMTLDPVITLQGLRDLNPGVVIEGAVYSNADKKFLPLPPEADIKAGQGIWVGAKSPIKSLQLPSATTLAHKTSVYTVTLHNGWNQIANPHLEDMYWPFSRALGDAYKSFPIKGTWEWDPSLEKPGYVETDILKPWRGYMVFNNLGDTTITLFPRPPGQGKASSLPKPGSGAGMHVSLGWGPRGPLRLGADWISQTGLGVEDEPALPTRERLSLTAVRDGRALVSDWVRMDYARISTWKVAMGGSGDSLPPLKVGGQDLPEGWEAWALAPSRGMRFRLEPGHEVPASGLTQDTLTVVAGPKDMLAKLGLMQSLALTAPDLDLSIANEPGGFQIRIALPSKARIRATLWSLDGRSQGSMSLGPLSGGAYRFAYAENFDGRPARLAPGMYFLSLEVKGQGVNARLSRKLVLTR